MLASDTAIQRDDSAAVAMLQIPPGAAHSTGT
jgi:hypothetical protein